MIFTVSETCLSGRALVYLAAGRRLLLGNEWANHTALGLYVYHDTSKWWGGMFQRVAHFSRRGTSHGRV